MELPVYQRNYHNASSHWWWLSKQKIFDLLINNLFNGNKKLKILDFGAGVGTNINLLKKFGEVHVYEPNKYAKDFIEENFKNIIFIDNLSHNNFLYDLILMSDVLEHIPSPIEELKKLKDKLSYNGKLLLTVPAHQYLFSKKDIHLHHFRRYSKKLLSSHLNNAKLKIEYMTYYNFFLSPLIIFATILSKILNFNHIHHVEKKPINILNKIFYNIFSFEGRFILNKKQLPYGISILSVASK